jgi:hypothetical protein
MARLDKETREALGTRLEKRLPHHWRVVVGSENYAFIELDQDGRRPHYERSAVGSAVIVVENRPGGKIRATRYERVPFPPGYCEGRALKGVVTEVSGVGWANKLIEAVVAAVAEVDVASVHTGVVAEA